jgi:predicted acyltransferase
MFKRMALLVLLSMLQCGLLQLDASKYQYVSVLQRIGITGFLASLAYVHLSPKWRLALSLAIVSGFWALLEFVPSPLEPEGAGAYAKSGNIVDWIDRFVSMRAWFGRDPFEIRDIPLSVVQVPIALLGMFAADIVRDGKFSQYRQVIRIAVIGAVLVVLGVVCVVLGCPLIKNLSTPSFMFLSGGLCMMLFAFFYLIVDVKGITAWCYPLRVVGINALMAYLMQTIIPISAISKFFFGGVAMLSGIPNVVNSIGYLAVCWLILYFLHRQKVYLKV